MNGKNTSVRSVGGIKVNVAVISLAASIVTAQSNELLQLASLQPLKVEPSSAVAVSVIVLFSTSVRLQVAPQSIPGGMLLT
jgi:hypothetical protein